MPLLNPEAGVAQGAGGVIEQGLLLCGAHLPEQVARLLVVVVVDAMIPPGRVALDLERRLDKGLISIHQRPLAVGPVGRLGDAIVIGPYRAGAVIAAEGARRWVQRDVVVVDAEEVGLGAGG